MCNHKVKQLALRILLQRLELLCMCEDPDVRVLLWTSPCKARTCACKLVVLGAWILHELSQVLAAQLASSMLVPVAWQQLENLSCSEERLVFESGNLGRQPETLKGIKLGGCLREQGVGEVKAGHQFLVCWYYREYAVARYAAPPHPWVCRGAISAYDFQPLRGGKP